MDPKKKKAFKEDIDRKAKKHMKYCEWLDDQEYKIYKKMEEHDKSYDHVLDEYKKVASMRNLTVEEKRNID